LEGETSMDAIRLWRAAVGQLELELAKPTFDTWLRNTWAVSYEDGVLVVGVQSAYAKDWLENRLYALIQRVVSKTAGRTVSVRFVVRRNEAVAQEDVGLLGGQASPRKRTWPGVGEGDLTRLNSKHTFANFIVGRSNRLAHAGSLAVAEKPGTSYNPLFIYGGVGLGKTHLLHAIGNRVLEDDKRALYVSAETFTNDLIKGIRTRTTEEFRAKYRTIDVLLIDDVQFIVNKERTQEEFFHTFNDLYQENRQIVLSSDRPPKAFVGLEERLRSRFEWGLTADVQPPDLETRMAILKAKGESQSVDLPIEVVEFIAQRFQTNIRELEGALNQVLGLSRMMGYPLTVGTAERALYNMMRTPVELTIDQVLDIVAAYFGLRVDDLKGPRRTKKIAFARHIAMYLARDLTDMSLPRIGQSLGGRDHSTILYGYGKIAGLFEKDDSIRRQILEIKNRLYSGTQRLRMP